MDKAILIDALISMMVLPFCVLLYWLFGFDFVRNPYLALTVLAGAMFSLALFTRIRFYRNYGE
jgi:hypothetical protein